MKKFFALIFYFSARLTQTLVVTSAIDWLLLESEFSEGN